MVTPFVVVTVKSACIPERTKTSVASSRAAAVDNVFTRAAGYRVGAASAEENIIAAATVENIVIVAAIQGVVSPLTHDGIGPGIADETRRRRIAAQNIGEQGADNNGHVSRTACRYCRSHRWPYRRRG